MEQIAVMKYWPIDVVLKGQKTTVRSTLRSEEHTEKPQNFRHPRLFYQSGLDWRGPIVFVLFWFLSFSRVGIPWAMGRHCLKGLLSNQMKERTNKKLIQSLEPNRF
uniref:Uncharacterized protein n=1 Tax=Cacopsylla melanoneura TaxID=428564 RepID=A0A8D8RAR1_9HEMI